MKLDNQCCSLLLRTFKIDVSTLVLLYDTYLLTIRCLFINE